MKERLTQPLREKEQLENEAKMKISNQKEEANILVEQFKTKMVMAEDSQKEMQRRILSIEADFNKQKALLEQKIEFLEKQLEETQKREQQVQKDS